MDSLKQFTICDGPFFSVLSDVLWFISEFLQIKNQVKGVELRGNKTTVKQE